MAAETTKDSQKSARLAAQGAWFSAAHNFHLIKTSLQKTPIIIMICMFIWSCITYAAATKANYNIHDKARQTTFIV